MRHGFTWGHTQPKLLTQVNVYMTVRWGEDLIIGGWNISDKDNTNPYLQMLSGALNGAPTMVITDN